MELPREPCVLIVGAGLAGLAAAVRLAEAGQSCLLLEREQAVGGLAKSLELDGVIFDYGPHVLFEDQEPGCRLLLEALSGEPVISRPFAFAFQAGGRHWAFPNHLDVFRYPWRFQREILTGLLAPGQSRPSGYSARDELQGKTGPGLYELLFKGMLRKKTALDGEALHRHWLMRPTRTVHGEVEPLPRRSRAATLLTVLKQLRKHYLYPARGFGTLADRLMRRYARAGGQIILDCGSIALEREADRIRAVSVRGRRVLVSQVVWTAPMAGLQRALGLNGAPPPRCEDILLVFMTYDCPHPAKRPFVYVYHPEPETVFNRSYYPASIFRKHGPLGREGLCLEITPGGVAGNPSVRDLAQRALADAERIGLIPAARLRRMKTLLLPGALPVYDLSYKKHMAEARQGIRAVENLVSVGRLGGWYFCMSPEAAAQGIKAARHVLAGTENRGAP